MKKPIVVIVGTRPEVIKMAPVVFALRESNSLSPVLVSTGQHREMLDQALSAFDLKADLDLNLMKPEQTLPELIARTIKAVANFIIDQAPSGILVQGDTSTVLGAAMAAFFENIPVGHIEAGLRTHNMRSPFPEEMNRRLTAPITKWHFCPTEGSRSNLLNEGVHENNIFVTGNTVVDSLLWIRDKQDRKGVCPDAVANRLNISSKFATKYLKDSLHDFILVTGHRRESFGHGFEQICHAINELTLRHPGVGILYPVHLNPNVQEPVNRILGNNPAVQLCSPAAYEDFVWLMSRARLILSDSGGVQEEAPSLGKPVLVMRDTTERPEGVTAGTCKLVGTNPERILNEAKILLEDHAEYENRCALKNPYGDGTAAKTISGILEKTYNPRG